MTGRAIANVLQLIGIFGLAFPVGVIGSELDRAYTKNFLRYMERSENMKRALLEEAGLDRVSAGKPGLSKKPVHLKELVQVIMDQNRESSRIASRKLSIVSDGDTASGVKQKREINSSSTNSNQNKIRKTYYSNGKNRSNNSLQSFPSLHSYSTRKKGSNPGLDNDLYAVDRMLLTGLSIDDIRKAKAGLTSDHPLQTSLKYPQSKFNAMVKSSYSSRIKDKQYSDSFRKQFSGSNRINPTPAPGNADISLVNETLNESMKSEMKKEENNLSVRQTQSQSKGNEPSVENPAQESQKSPKRSFSIASSKSSNGESDIDSVDREEMDDEDFDMLLMRVDKTNEMQRISTLEKLAIVRLQRAKDMLHAVEAMCLIAEEDYIQLKKAKLALRRQHSSDAEKSHNSHNIGGSRTDERSLVPSRSHSEDRGDKYPDDDNRSDNRSERQGDRYTERQSSTSSRQWLHDSYSLSSLPPLVHTPLSAILSVDNSLDSSSKSPKQRSPRLGAIEKDTQQTNPPSNLLNDG